MKDRIDLEMWKGIQDEFSKELEMLIITIDSKGRELAVSNKYPFFCEIVRNKGPGKKSCRKCKVDAYNELDKDVIEFKCCCGLRNIIAPVVITGVKRGAVIIGPFIKTKEKQEEFDEIASLIGVEAEDLMDEIECMEVKQKEKVEDFRKIMKVLTRILSEIGPQQRILKERLEKLNFIQKVADSFNGSLNMTDILKGALSFIVDEFDLINCSIILFDQGNRYAFKQSSEAVKKAEYILSGQVRNTKNYVKIDNVRKDFMLEKIDGIEKEDYSVLGYPLIMKNEVGGVISFYKKSNSFTEEEYKVLPMLVSRLAQSINNSASFRKMKDFAITDKLTGLYNRSYFTEIFKKEIAQGRRKEKPISVALFDLDDFKKFNDSFGHSIGDEILSKMGDIVKKQVRGFDTVCRYGGEEFVIIMPGIDAKEALIIGERIRKAIEEYRFGVYEDRLKNVTVSVGLVTCMNSSMSEQEMLNLSDKNLYKAKQSGKNMVVSSIAIDRNLGAIEVQEADRLYVN